MDKNSKITLIIKSTLERSFLMKKNTKKCILKNVGFHCIQPSYVHDKETLPNPLIKIALIYPLSSNLKGKAMLYEGGVDSETYANLS